MLWTVFVVILVLWLLGFSFHIAGELDSYPARDRSDCSCLQPAIWAAGRLRERDNRAHLSAE